MIETSALVAIILEEPGWRQVAEQIVQANALTTCVNVFEAALAIVRERDLKPTAGHAVVRELANRLAIEVRSYDAAAIPHAVAARERFGRAAWAEHGRLPFLRRGEAMPGAAALRRPRFRADRRQRSGLRPRPVCPPRAATGSSASGFPLSSRRSASPAGDQSTRSPRRGSSATAFT